MEFSIIHLDGSSEERAQAYSLITGYLSENLPKKLIAYFSKVYKKAAHRVEREGAYRAERQRPIDVNGNDDKPDIDYATINENNKNEYSDKDINDGHSGENHNEHDVNRLNDHSVQDDGYNNDAHIENDETYSDEESSGSVLEPTKIEYSGNSGEEAKRLKFRRSVVSQSESEEERISRERSEKKKT